MIFGDAIFILDFVIVGKLTRKHVEVLSEAIITAIGMSPAYEPVCWPYPINGKGGEGFTFVQPLTESWIGFDVYPDHTFVFLKSCKPFNPLVVYEVAEMRDCRVHWGPYRDLLKP